MNPQKFQTFVNERYQVAVDWYDQKAIINKKYSNIFQFILIILSALTPVLIAINFGFEEYGYFKWFAVATAVIVSISSSSLRIFKFHDNWISYRNICETLKKEINFYDSESGDYAHCKDKESVFVQNVESLISMENNLWKTSFKKIINIT